MWTRGGWVRRVGGASHGFWGTFWRPVNDPGFYGALDAEGLDGQPMARRAQPAKSSR